MKKLACIAAAAAVGLTSPAFAASFANASMSGFSVTLIDLNPADTFAPSIRWIPDPVFSASTVFGNASIGRPFNSQSFFDSRNGVFLPASGSAATPASRASASVSGGQVQGGSTRASGSAVQVAGDPGAGSSFSAQSYPTGLGAARFTLSPNTMAVFSTQGSVRAQTTLGNFQSRGSTYTEAAQARVELTASGIGAGGEPLISGDSLNAQVGGVFIIGSLSREAFLTEFGPRTLSEARRLSVSFANRGGNPLEGALAVNAFVTGESAVAAVPEPEVYAMLMAGLGVVGGIARRRKKEAS